MKTIFIDSEYHCHISDDGTMTSIETDFFDGKCDTFIEGYRFVPAGESWKRSDGVIFTGEMITPWRPYRELDRAQRSYEHEQYLTSLERDAQYLDAYNEGVNEV